MLRDDTQGNLLHELPRHQSQTDRPLDISHQQYFYSCIPMNMYVCHHKIGNINIHWMLGQHIGRICHSSWFWRFLEYHYISGMLGNFVPFSWYKFLYKIPNKIWKRYEHVLKRNFSFTSTCRSLYYLQFSSTSHRDALRFFGYFDTLWMWTHVKERKHYLCGNLHNSSIRQFPCNSQNNASNKELLGWHLG